MSREGKPGTDPRRILIVRLSALGDVALSSGLIPALRTRWPQASLSWLVEPPAAPLLRDNPRLDEVIVLPVAEWKKLWRGGQRMRALREILAFRRALRERRFDLVVDPQGLLKSGVCGWMTGAPRRVSLLPREMNGLLVHETVRIPSDDNRLIGHEYRTLARYLGARDDDFRLDLQVGEAARTRARQCLAGKGATRPLAILAAFTTRPQKHWVASRWSELARRLADDGLQPVLLGGPADAAAAAEIAAGCPAILDLTGQLKLDESVAVIAGSALLVGVDTGLTHMAIGLDIPTVALFGSTLPYRCGDTPSSHVIYHPLPCSPCNRAPTCGGRFTCMKEIDVPEILAAVARVRSACAA